MRETDLTEEFYATFDGRIPAPLQAELSALRYRLRGGQRDDLDAYLDLQ